MSGELSTSSMPIAVTVYLPVHYPRLLATAEDARDLEVTWQEVVPGGAGNQAKASCLDLHRTGDELSAREGISRVYYA